MLNPLKPQRKSRITDCHAIIVAWQLALGFATLLLVAEHHYRQLQKRLGASLRKRRNELGLTQEDVSDLLGMVARQYQKIEAGEVNVTLRTLTRLAIALKVNVRDLL